MSGKRGLIFDIGEGTVHDGPGLRVTVFMKGCPLRCRWCHSPEGWSAEPQMLVFPHHQTRRCGEWHSSDELADYLKGIVPLLGSDGGVTFSGGEPMMQADFLEEILEGLSGIHTLVETTGMCSGRRLLDIAEKCSYIHYGLKVLDDDVARYWTHASVQTPLENLQLLDQQSDTPYCLRMPLIPGVVDTEENLRLLQELTQSLSRLERIDFLPSNKLAPAKYPSCGLAFDGGYDLEAEGVIPEWFRPSVPWNILE